MYVANVDEAGFTDNPRLDRVREIAKSEGAIVVPICAAIEAEIAQLDEADRAEFLAELKLDEPGLNRVIRGGYSLLGLQTYFTAGVKEVRAWTVRIGATDHRELAMMLVERYKAYVDSADKDHFTPLHYSCRRGYLSLILFLLEKGADPTSRNVYEDTQLHWFDSPSHTLPPFLSSSPFFT